MRFELSLNDTEATLVKNLCDTQSNRSPLPGRKRFAYHVLITTNKSTYSEIRELKWQQITTALAQRPKKKSSINSLKPHNIMMWADIKRIY